MTHPYIPPQPGGPGAYEQQLAARCRRLEQDRFTLETELGQARQRNAELQQRAETAEAELAGARATIDHMSQAMSWISGHDRQGLDHLEEAQREARARENAVKQARKWAARARAAETRVRELQARLDEINDRQQVAPEISVQVDGEWKPVGHLLKAEPATLTARYLSYPRPACTECGRAVHAPLGCDQADTLAMKLDSYFTAQIKAMRDEGQL